MPNYIQDPNDSKKQIPGPKPDNAYDRVGTAQTCSILKQPNSVLVTIPLTNTVGFFFGSSGSFMDASEGSPHLDSASNYTIMLSGSADHSAGTKLDIHPVAWSGSKADAGKIMFIYKGGLDGPGRP